MRFDGSVLGFKNMRSFEEYSEDEQMEESVETATTSFRQLVKQQTVED